MRRNEDHTISEVGEGGSDHATGEQHEIPIPEDESLSDSDLEENEVEEQFITIALGQGCDDQEEFESSSEMRGFCDALDDRPPFKFNQYLGANSEKSLVDLLTLDVYHNAYSKALNVLTKYIGALCPGKGEDFPMELFDLWLFNALPRLELTRPTDYDVCRHFCKYDDLKPLDLAALRLISVSLQPGQCQGFLNGAVPTAK